MKIAKSSEGTEFYYKSEVDSKISELKNRIRELENELSISKDNNRGGNVANLTPRQPKYDEQIQKEIARRVKLGESKNKLSKEFNITRATVLNYCRKFEQKNIRKPVEKINFSDEILEDESVPKVKNYFPPKEPVAKISADPLQGGSNIFGTKRISENFRDRD